MSKIISIGTAVPPFKNNQSDICQFMIKLLKADDKLERKLKILYEKSSIQTRYSVIPDYSSSTKNRIFYPKTDDLEPFPDLEHRMEKFHPAALELSLKSAENCLSKLKSKPKITHLISVTCTGLSAPGLDLELVHELKLPSSVTRTSINFMGCYAAFHALKIADSICKADEKAVVLIVCTELCTLHFQKSLSTDDLVANSLFADGSASVLVASDLNRSKGLLLKSFHSEIARHGSKDMAWKLSKSGFLMSLTSYVPELVLTGIQPLMKSAVKKSNVKKIDHWAIHPGGRKILEVSEKALNLKSEHLSASYETLQNYGNMSSPTVLFVLEKFFSKRKNMSGETIFAAGFGPGLTLESAVLEIE